MKYIKKINIMDIVNLDLNSSNIIIFGVGLNGTIGAYLLKYIHHLHIKMCFDNYSEKKELWGIPISEPVQSSGNDVILNSIQNEKVIPQIKKQCAKLGYDCVWTIDQDSLFKEMNSLSDKEYLEVQYKIRMNEYLDYNNVVSFSEKIQYLKVYDKNERYHHLVDKYEVKKFVTELIGKEYVTPTLGIWEDFSSIDFSELPDSFVLKCTHDSGSVSLIENKFNVDYEELKRKYENALNVDYYKLSREWVYKGVKPRIMAEPLLISNESNERSLRDYKVFVFSGIAKLIQVDIDRFGQHKRNFYNTDWEYQDIRLCYPTCADKKEEAPHCLKNLLEFSQTLAEGIPFVRIDFYIINDRIYFGEMTFYPEAGFEEFQPKQLAIEAGGWIDIKTCKQYNHAP